MLHEVRVEVRYLRTPNTNLSDLDVLDELRGVEVSYRRTPNTKVRFIFYSYRWFIFYNSPGQNMHTSVIVYTSTGQNGHN